MLRVYLILTCLFGLLPAANGQGKKSLVELALSVTDSQGNPVSGTFSLSVTDAAVVKPDSVQPMLDSYMLLNSELKGNIENPNYYFKAPDRRTAHHLDLLMMTQGWRRYNLDNITKGEYPEITHSIETGQTISGEVKGTLGNKVRNVNLHLVTPHIGKHDVIPLNDNRRFTITGLDFADGTTFLLQAVRDSGRDKFLQLEVDSVTFPTVDVPANEEQKKLMSLPQSFDTQARTQVMYAGTDGITELPEVVKTATVKIKPKNRLGQAPHRWITEEDPYLAKSGDLYNVFSRLGIRYRVVEEGDPPLTRKSTSGLVFVDNIELDHHESDIVLDNLHPETISAIEYFPPRHPALWVYGFRIWNKGALFIFTKMAEATLTISMKSITPKGYKPELEFYSPQYPAKDKSIYTRPDHRTTLYWNPRVMTDEEGKASVSFYSSDVSKKYLVTLEGLTDDGVAISEVIQVGD
ncbi:MAG: hypothetical protein IJB46_01385 [Prevotella sp.]|nr:hypothetical protein [Prevotella sp.]